MEEAFNAAWEAYVQESWGGWALFAKLHTQVSGAAEKAAFLAGFAAAWGYRG